jgi:hypothetical protein
MKLLGYIFLRKAVTLLGTTHSESSASQSQAMEPVTAKQRLGKRQRRERKKSNIAIQ